MVCSHARMISFLQATKWRHRVCSSKFHSTHLVILALIFLAARRYAGAGLCESNVYVCPSVCPSVTRRYCVKTKKAMISLPSGSPTILVFWCQISSQNSKRVTPSGGVKQGWVGKNQQFSIFKLAWISRKR